ncbi:TPA: histidinol dehydrogenase, partial [Staphylococcus pseudintermedius]|nr:histidinol dehydrogenase [Staphylococcus pseudintermedius]
MIVNSQTFLQQFETTETFNPEIHAQVTAICERVRREGDLALHDYNQQFDGIKVEALEVPQADIAAAYHNIDEDLRHALEHSFRRIRDYQTQIKYENQYA